MVNRPCLFSPVWVWMLPLIKQNWMIRHKLMRGELILHMHMWKALCHFWGNSPGSKAFNCWLHITVKMVFNSQTRWKQIKICCLLKVKAVLNIFKSAGISLAFFFFSYINTKKSWFSKINGLLTNKMYLKILCTYFLLK